MKYLVAMIVYGMASFPSCQPVTDGPIGMDPQTPVTDTLDLSLADLIDSLNIDVTQLRLHVDKSERRMRMYAGDLLLTSYPCVLGLKPEGDKMQEGDRRTPEGRFTFRAKYPHADWHKFIWIDYPNAESRRRFKERKASGTVAADASMGGEIGIHGVPIGMDLWITLGADWTWGCIAMKNADVDEIFTYIVPERTEIEIVP